MPGPAAGWVGAESVADAASRPAGMACGKRRLVGSRGHLAGAHTPTPPPPALQSPTFVQQMAYGALEIMAVHL